MVNLTLFPAYSSASSRNVGQLAEDVKKELTDTKLLAQRIKTEACTIKEGKSILRSTGSMLAPRTISNLDEELLLLRRVHMSAKEFHAGFNKFQKECSDELSKLSIFRPSTWKSLFLETVDLILITLLAGLVSVGTHRIGSFRAGEKRDRVEIELKEMKYVEVQALGKLQNVDSIKLLEAYWMISDLDPTDQEAQDKLAHYLKEAGVYDLAAELLKSLLAKHAHSVDLWQEYVDSLIKQGNHQGAETAIDEIRKKFAKELKEEKFLCMHGRNASRDELLNAFKELKTKEQNIIKMMFDSEVKQVLKDPTEKNLEELKQQLYFIQDVPSELIRNMQASEAGADFWLELLVQCVKFNESKETKDLIVSKLKAFDKEVLHKSCAKIRSQEATQAASNLGQTTLPDSLKAMLEEASKQSEKQKALLNQYRKAALSLLES